MCSKLEEHAGYGWTSGAIFGQHSPAAQQTVNPPWLNRLSLVVNWYLSTALRGAALQDHLLTSGKDIAFSLISLACLLSFPSFLSFFPRYSFPLRAVLPRFCRGSAAVLRSVKGETVRTP